MKLKIAIELRKLVLSKKKAFSLYKTQNWKKQLLHQLAVDGGFNEGGGVMGDSLIYKSVK